jgi:hypothetical protein
VRWTGSAGTAPAAVWLLVESKANYEKTAGSGSASNGMGTQLVPYTSTVNVPPVKSTTGERANGRKIYRLNLQGGSVTLTFSLSASATVNASPTTEWIAAGCSLKAEITDKQGALARNDGGTHRKLEHDTYEADTLLSWPVTSTSGAPGPTAQSLNGTFSGTWSSKTHTRTNGTTFVGDDVIVNWSGASPYGPSSVSPPNPDSVRSTTYPPTGGSGLMPLESGTLAPITHSWEYRVADVQDGTELPLKWKWICHYAYEITSQLAVADRVVNSRVFAEYVSSAAPTASLNVPLINPPFSITTTWEDPTDTSQIPGFQAEGKHIALARLQARWGQTATYTNDGTGQHGSTTVTWDPMKGNGLYGWKFILKVPDRLVLAKAWNAKGESRSTSAHYILDDEGQSSLDLYFAPEGI